jgi:hypothetical protein
LPDLALADFFLFRRVNEELAGLSLDDAASIRQGKGSSESSTPMTLPPLRQWFERCKKCIQIDGGCEKAKK